MLALININFYIFATKHKAIKNHRGFLTYFSGQPIFWVKGNLPRMRTTFFQQTNLYFSGQDRSHLKPVLFLRQFLSSNRFLRSQKSILILPLSPGCSPTLQVISEPIPPASYVLSAWSQAVAKLFRIARLRHPCPVHHLKLLPPDFQSILIKEKIK